MITPRRTTLIRVPDLRAMHRAIASVALHTGDPLHEVAVLVASTAGATQMRKTLERLGAGDAVPWAAAMPRVLTRAQWYRHMYARVCAVEPLLSEIEREVLLRSAAADAAAAGCTPPFELRPTLIAAVVELYDALRRNLRTVDAFERLVVGELEPSREVDRGAARLLEQTRFLVAAFRAYEHRLDAIGALDESRLRSRLLEERERTAFDHLVVAVPDVVADPIGGLWPADLDLITRQHGLARVDVVATERMLAAGLHDRLVEALPGIEFDSRAGGPRSRPTLRVPAAVDDGVAWLARDREEELIDAARAIKRAALEAGRRSAPARVAIVYQRPLPYLYLARTVFGAAGIPYEAEDALPLASEPFAAVLDLVIETAAAGADGGSLDLAALEANAHVALDRTRADPDAELAALRERAPVSAILERLLAFVARHTRPLDEPDEASAGRLARGRAAALESLRALRDAHRRYDDPVCDLHDVFARIARWIEAHTFNPRLGAGGVQLLDARAARYGDLDAVRLVGLVEPDWPERSRPNIFYPPAILSQLGWPRDRERIAAARAEFEDLLALAETTVELSTFALDDDRIVAPSSLLDSAIDASLPIERVESTPPVRTMLDEALAEDPVREHVVEGLALDWLRHRRARMPRSHPAFHGSAGPRPARTFSVTSVEQYVRCPFQHFSRRVLALGDEPAGDESSWALERGRFVHDLLHDFFLRWTADGQAGITRRDLPRARACFTRLADERLASVPAPERIIERHRLLGSALEAGVAERLFRLELHRPGRLATRHLEFDLGGEWTLSGHTGGRRLHVTGVADRIDVLADDSLWLLDYKTGRAPAAGRSVQLAVYAACARQRLAREAGGRPPRVAEAAYLALGDRDLVVSLAPRSGDLDERIVEGEARFLEAVSGIEAGRFPPRPVELTLCATCAYPAVCRKDYVYED